MIRKEINTLEHINAGGHGADGAIKCMIAGVETDMIIDSGSAFSTISQDVWSQLHDRYLAGGAALIPFRTPNPIRAFAYAQSSPLKIIAHFSAPLTTATIARPVMEEEFIVVHGAHRSLLSKDTAMALNILRMGGDVMSIEASATRTDRKFPVAPYPEVDVDIDESIPPSRQYYYRIPEAFEQRVKEKIAEMLEMDIIERAGDDPQWLSGLSIVIKDVDKFRLVLNMRRVNQAIRRPYLIIPTIDDVRHQIKGSRFFSKFDLTSAFFHLVLSERARNMTCFMTRDGIFRYKRLPFGLVSAPEVFQRFMNTVLDGIEGAVAYLDDILVHASTREELNAITKKVRDRLSQYNLSVNVEKSEEGKEELTFLGHRINKDGINIEEMKLKSIQSFRSPTSKQELRSFLGLAGFLSQFITAYSHLTEPLWKVLRGPNAFRWEQEQEDAFKELKDRISGCTTALGAFDPQAPVVLYTDASPHALSAVLTQPKSTGGSVIVSCASRTLTETERRYDQTNKEALAIVYGAEHYQFYLLGRSFTIRTDSAGAVASINKVDLSTNKCIMRRINGYKNRMEMFNVTYDLISSKDNIADAPSRLTTGEPEEEAPTRPGFEIGTLDSVPGMPIWAEVLTEHEVRTISATDPVTLAVVQALTSEEDWPEHLRAYKKHESELTFKDGILSRAGRIVVPLGARQKALILAHEGHPGVNGMKRMLRASLWWPKMDEQVEGFIRACKICFHIIKANTMVPMKRTRMPSESWDMLAIDHFGPIAELDKAYVLVMIDYHSRYLFAAEVKTTDFNSTKTFMDRIFAERGWPRSIRADNGSPFRKSFDDYCLQRGITPEHSLPFTPFQNGLVESAMGIIGKALMVARADRLPFGRTLRQAVQAHNMIPHSTSGLIPAEAHFGAKVRHSLPMLRDLPRPLDIEAAQARDWERKIKDKERRDRIVRAKEPEIGEGDMVVCINRSKTKAESNYGTEQFKVIKANYGNLTILSATGKQRLIHIKDVKKVPATLRDDYEERLDEQEDSDVIPPAPATGVTTGGLAEQEEQAAAPTDTPTAAPAKVLPRRSARIRKGTRKADFVYMLAKCLMQEHEHLLDLLVEEESEQEDEAGSDFEHTN